METGEEVFFLGRALFILGTNVMLNDESDSNE